MMCCRWLRGSLLAVVLGVSVRAAVESQDFQVSSSNPTGIAPPTIAASPSSFLIAWDDFSAGPSLPQLLGSIVTSTGIASAPFAISNPGGAPRPYRLQRI